MGNRDVLEEIRQLRADNRRLRRLLESSNAPAELRHRLRSTIALLLQLIRQSASRATDIDTYAAHLADRVAAIGRAQAAADDHGSVDLHAVVSDELSRFRVLEGERLELSGPTVRFNARAGQSIALAIHELALNAIEHGPLGADTGQLSVTWRIENELPGQNLLLEWRESGPVLSEASEPGFGTETVTNLLSHELRARTLLSHGTAGTSCTIRIPWNDRLGSLSDEKVVSLFQ